MPKQLVLSVEDNDADFHIIEMALKECQNSLTIFRLCDGEQAIEFLSRLEGAYVEAEVPDLIILDANMPKYNGFEVLGFISSHARICQIPVVMFTSSSNAAEKKRALALGASEFVTKVSDLDQVLGDLNRVCTKHLL